jgi:transposase
MARTIVWTVPRVEVSWLQGLPGQVRACYEAGPTGFGLYRAIAAGVDLEVIAPGKTPRGPSDRMETDRKDVLMPPGGSPR